MSGFELNSMTKSCLSKPGSKRKAKQCRFGKEPTVVINKIPYGNDDRYLLPNATLPNHPNMPKPENENMKLVLDSLPSNTRELLAQAGISRLHVHSCSENPEPRVGEELLMQIAILDDGQFLVLGEDSSSTSDDEAEEDANGKARQCRFDEVPKMNEFVESVVKLVKKVERKHAKNNCLSALAIQLVAPKPKNEIVQLDLDSLPPNTRELLTQARVNRLHVHTGSEAPAPYEGEELLMQIAILDDGRYLVLDADEDEEDEEDEDNEADDEGVANGKALQRRSDEVPKMYEFVHTVVKLVKKEERKQARSNCQPDMPKSENDIVQLDLDSLPPETRELLAHAHINRLVVHTSSEDPQPQEGEEVFMRITLDSSSRIPYEDVEDGGEEDEGNEDEDTFYSAEGSQDLEDENEFEDAREYQAPGYPHICYPKIAPSMAQENYKEPETFTTTYMHMGPLKRNNNQGPNRDAREYQAPGCPDIYDPKIARSMAHQNSKKPVIFTATYNMGPLKKNNNQCARNRLNQG